MGVSLKVAVIGAGISGLNAARELQREGHRVVVFEKAQRLGGLWVYDPRVETDQLGLDPNREIVHSSVYHSLRTNLPRHIMGFSDYSFQEREYGDPRAYPGHQEVLKFFEDFATEFKLTEMVRFNAEVVRVERVDSRSDEWVVESRTSGLSSEEVFEAVVVCNGHSTEPRLASDIPGIEKWPKKQVHSHNYRVPEPFRDQIVVMIGTGPSAHDISREIAMVAKEVHISSRSLHVKVSKLESYNNIWQHSKIDHVYEDGVVSFEDGFSTVADIIFHCTGYNYNFPFLETNGIVSIEENSVGPLYKHVFPPELAPWLSFIALPQGTIGTRMIELQSKWIAQALSGKVLLPSKEQMMNDVEEHYRKMEEEGFPKHYTHHLHFKVDYLDWVAAQVGSPLEERQKEIFRHLLENFCSCINNFRDVLDPKNFVCKLAASKGDARG